METGSPGGGLVSARDPNEFDNEFRLGRADCRCRGNPRVWMSCRCPEVGVRGSGLSDSAPASIHEIKVY